MTKKMPVIAAVVLAVLALSVCISAPGAGPSYSAPEDTVRHIEALIDQELTGETEAEDEMEEVALITVKNTFVRENVIRKTGGTLDSYYSHIRTVGYPDGYVFTAESRVPLFDPGSGSEYVVGRMDTDPSVRIYDHVFAENNFDGIVLDGDIFYPDSGMIYVRKSDLYHTSEEGIMTDYVQLQLLSGYREKTCEIRVSCGLADGEEFTHIQDLSDPFVEIDLSDSFGDAAKDLSQADLSIYVNGSGVPLGYEAYSLNEGRLTLFAAPASIFELRIGSGSARAGLLSGVLSALFHTTDTYALTTTPGAITDEAGVWIGKAAVGDYAVFTARGVNTRKGAMRNYIQTVAGSAPGQEDFYDALIGHDADAAGEYVTGTYGGGKKNVYRSDYNADYGIDMSTARITSCSSGYLGDYIANIDSVIQMSCIEVKKAVYRDFGNDPYLEFTAMVTAKGEDYIALTFCSREKTSKNSSNQVLCGTYAISYAPLTIDFSYDTNGGFWPDSSHIDSEKVTFGEGHIIQTLPYESEPRRAGYAFAGWALSDENAPVYKGGETVPFSDPESGDITLYASWRAADNERILWTEYGRGDLFVSEDTHDNTLAGVPVPQSYRGLFEGYYICTGRDENGQPIPGALITDKEGSFIETDIEGVLSGGVFVNEGPIELIPVFDWERGDPAASD